MRLVLILFFCFLKEGLFGQNTCPIEIKSQSKITCIYGGIIFEPISASVNRYFEGDCAPNQKNIVFNHLELTKDQFLSLRMKPYYLTNDSTNVFNRNGSKRGHGTFEYRFDKNADCPYLIEFRLNTELPLYLNDTLVDLANQKEIFSQILPSEIKSISRESSLFGKGRIMITTK